MTKNKLFKRALAGMTAFALIAGAVPAQTFDKGWFSFAPVVANAEDVATLTVCDGTVTNGYVPVYGYYADEYLKCQYIIPADELDEMAYGKISAMTFYSDKANADWGNANFEVYLTETEATSISDFVDYSDHHMVYEGSLGITNNTMTVNFDDEYEYEGDNLLVTVINKVKGSYVSASFYGVTSNGSCVQNYSSSSVDSITANQRNFLPKTTFTYEPVVPHEPCNVTLNGGENATAAGETSQSQVEKKISEVIFTADDGYYFEQFEPKYTDGIKVKWIDRYTIKVTGAPTTNTTVTVPDAVEIPTVAFTGAANSTKTGSWKEGFTYTPTDGYYFAKFDDIVQDGITVKWVYIDTVTVTGFPTADTTITIPAARQIDFTLYDFEGDNSLDGWTFVDADGDGHNWLPSNMNECNYDYSGVATFGVPFIVSASFIDYVGAFNTDNWAISPKIKLSDENAFVSFYAKNANGNYRDSFSLWVADVSDGSNPNLSTIDENEWTMVRASGTVSAGYYDPWEEVEADLSAYAGKTIRFAIRHKDYDKYELWVDNVMIGGTEIDHATDISTATVTVNTTAKTVSAELDGESLDSEGYTVKYYKANDETDEGTETFPTQGGKYVAKITAKPDSGYTGVGVSEVFVIDKLIEGTHMITTTKNDKPYTRVIFVVPKTDLAGVQSIKFTVTKEGVTKTATSKKYYSGSALDDVTYTPASSDCVLLCVSVSNATADQIECSYTLNK